VLGGQDHLARNADFPYGTAEIEIVRRREDTASFPNELPETGAIMTFAIGDIFHIVHTCPDVRVAEPWYRDHLGAREASPMTYLDIEKRWAVFLDVAGVVLEPMSVDPFKEGDRLTPIQRFVSTFGYRWHSLAYFVDGLPGLYDRLRDAGVRMFKTGGGPVGEGPLPENAGAIWTHPRDTFGLIEFAGVHPVRHELPEESPDKGSGPPSARALGIRGLACVTYVPRDMDAARRFYVDTLGGSEIGRREWPWYGSESLYVRLGRSTVVELARPCTDAGVASADLQGSSDVLHAATLAVDDVAALAKHLTNGGIGVMHHGPDLVINPADGFGATLRFTEQPPGR
jgi:catechol 2,3-dioxygenase-like lactoylglutathione lyase family enzyme